MSDIDDIDETIRETEEVLNGTGDATNGEASPTEAETTDDSDDTGISVPDLSAWPTAVVAAASPFLTILPGSWRVYHKLNRWSAYKMQKAASADGVANVRLENGHEDLRPAKWVRGAEDEKEGSGWKVKGLDDRRFDGAVDGRSTTRYGKANMLHLLSDGAEVASWAEPAMDNAIQLGREQYLFRDAKMAHITVEGDPEAMTDGGATRRESYISVEQPGVAQDCLVPVSSRSGYDGQMVSWNRYQTLKKENADQDKIRDAKNSAWTAAKLDDIDGMDVLKWMIIIGIWSAILLFHQDIGAAISGLTSGGGGGAGGVAGNALGMIYLGLGGV